MDEEYVLVTFYMNNEEADFFQTNWHLDTITPRIDSILKDGFYKHGDTYYMANHIVKIVIG